MTRRAEGESGAIFMGVLRVRWAETGEFRAGRGKVTARVPAGCLIMPAMLPTARLPPSRALPFALQPVAGRR